LEVKTVCAEQVRNRYPLHTHISMTTMFPQVPTIRTRDRPPGAEWVRQGQVDYGRHELGGCHSTVDGDVVRGQEVRHDLSGRHSVGSNRWLQHFRSGRREQFGISP
jgi:hypothetical protein